MFGLSIGLLVWLGVGVIVSLVVGAAIKRGER